MASTVARETMLTPSEVDSESSSVGDERDTQKRIREDIDSSSPKKRRKQTTPVRVPANDRTESEEELEDDQEVDGIKKLEDENKRLFELGSFSTEDENLNTEFRCQYCGRPFEDNESLSHHLENDHGINNLSLISSNMHIKLEPHNQQDDFENPVNLSGLGMKNLATSWLSGHPQLQGQEPPTDWTGQNPVKSMASHLSGLPFSGGLGQYLPLPSFSLGETGQLPRLPMAPRIFNPDAYCDLCNKEFCNKYFLKTHKANKHGIYMDGILPNPNENNGLNFCNLPFQMVNVQIDQPIQNLSQKIENPLTVTISCPICQKKFKNDESLRKHKQKCRSENSQSDLQSDSQSSMAGKEYNISLGNNEKDISTSSPGAMESLFKQEYGIEQEDAKYVPAPRHMSPQSIQQARDSGFNPDKLRKLGVMNIEAFCEICCKEYCNKYFLRTHKMKRHGILIPDNEKSPTTPGAAATWHQIQTSPLNLIVTESNPGGSESNDKSEEYQCKLCGIKFQTHGLYQLHRSKMHEISDDDEKSIKQDIEEERTDSISEDLQKLQTMILQLNGLESSKTWTCEICGRECENRLALKTHMTLEHASNLPDEQPPLSPGQLPENSLNNTSANLVYCTLCEREFQNHDTLRQHIAEDHNQQTSPIMKNNSSTTNNVSQIISSVSLSGTQLVSSIPPTSSAPPSSIPSIPPIPPPPDKKLSSLTPTSSYCEICNKELCNKYFMKTHMQRMHGIEIENGSQIGGVICNICNKELCSKYFLRVHKHNTHGIVDEGTAANTNKSENIEAPPPPPPTDDAALKPDQLGDLSHRYFTHFNEVCPICNRRFRSIKWLKAHLLGEHGKPGIDKWRELEQQYQNTSRNRVGSVGASSRVNQQNQNIKIPNGLVEIGQNIKTNEYGGGLGNQVLSTLLGGNEEQQKKNYGCSYCNFTTPVLPFLFLHERLHMSNQENVPTENSLQCPICSETFGKPELLHHHLVIRHQFSNSLSHYQQQMAINELRPEGNQEPSELIEQKEIEYKDDKSGDGHLSPIIQPSVEIQKNREEPGTVHVTPQGAYKCAECGFATANLQKIKSHVKKSHKGCGDPTESVIAELSKTLRDIANKHKVPASYAMPQDMNSNPEATIMQPFIIEERNCTFGDETSNNDRRFAPALVYLPVRTRINSILTASFTLSPASITS